MSTNRFGIATPGATPPSPANALMSVPDPEAAQRRRRWPRVVAVVVAAVVVVGGAFWIGWVTSPTPSRPRLASVLETTVALQVGAPVPASDLRDTTIGTADVPAGALRPGQLATVKSQRAATPLAAGTVLTSGDLTAQAYPPAGQALVGVQLSPAEVPAGALAPGVEVEVLAVPAASQPPYPAPQALTVATVWSSAADTNGTAVVIDLPAQLSATVAGEAAHDEISLVLPGG